MYYIKLRDEKEYSEVSLKEYLYYQKQSGNFIDYNQPMPSFFGNDVSGYAKHN